MMSSLANSRASTGAFSLSQSLNSYAKRNATLASPRRGLLVKAQMSGGESSNPNSQALDVLSENLSAAGHAMKIEELQVRADAAIEEATLMDEQAQAIEAEAERLTKDVEKRISEETDEARKRIHERMLAVAQLDAKEQRIYANAIREIADKAVAELDMAQATSEEGDSS